MSARRHLPMVPAASVNAAYERIDAQLAEARRQAEQTFGPVPCTEGCANCCYRPAYVAHHEVPALVEGLRRLSPEQQRTVKDRVQRWREATRTAGIDPGGVRDEVPGYVEAVLPCPLLDRSTNLCTVYEHRPLACRGELIVDRTGRGGADCREPVVELTRVDVGHLAARSLYQLVAADVRVRRARRPSARPELVILLLPEMLDAAWNLVTGTATWETWRRKIVQERPQVGVEAVMNTAAAISTVLAAPAQPQAAPIG